ncbi:hypothetical protein [Holdemanella biformis]|uniref:hypothetical protein n=1 Tax=Holdemanella biformis TaxID=1735 RepID=UPI00189C457E|nr:hypothetical protein [Holdemanella biformis]
MKTNKLLMAGALAFSMVLSGGMLTGCSNSSNTKDTKTSEVTKKKEVKTLGQKSKDSKSLKFTNSTGKKITVFETKSSSEENFSDNLLENGDVVKNKEERTLYYEVKENDKLNVKIGLQDQDKAFVFKDVDTTDVKKVDVSLKEDKVNLDVTKKDGSTATLTPSEDSVKTEEEKKDESEVKKEEKKEETAKADTSNKSNTSGSKKENTTATTNTSSNKNNSSTSSSKPAEHTHDWVAQYKTVNVPEKGHNEQVMVQAAYDEQVPVTEMQEICVGNQSGLQINGDPNEYLLNNSNGDSGWHSEWRETVVGYKTVHHDAVYETRYVVDSPATTKQELTGYKCSSCGKMKAN